MKNLISIINELSKLNEASDTQIQQIFRKCSKNGSGLYKKTDVLEAFNEMLKNKSIKLNIKETKNFLKNIQMKQVRTISGVTPVTVLTKPFPCPGKCIFCPNDVRMPKSYLSDEPGAQRATRNKFDPYAQTYNRLLAYKAIGHITDKVELIILGGTWTSYPESYQIWFVKRCFDAINDFDEDSTIFPVDSEKGMPFEDKDLEEIQGEIFNKSYNEIISKALLPKRSDAQREKSTWKELLSVQKVNETSITRCIGLVIETRPDEITEQEVVRIRKLGATKTQIGFQSLNNKVLDKNKRGHNVQTTRNAVKLLRQAGFKIHAHWMPNLYGSTPKEDIKDYKKMFDDKDFRPDELKIYPCSLIASAELMQYYKKGLWKPYTPEALSHVLKEVFKNTPAYCRITRMIRDIGSQDIVIGNKKTNYRQIVEAELKKEGFTPLEIRSREIKNKEISLNDLHLDIVEYETSCSNEFFLQYVTEQNEIAGFLRLSIPTITNFLYELKGCAIIREVHVYGISVPIGEHKEGKAQHLGLGTKLIEEASKISRKNNFKSLAVISSIGTREYYKKFGFKLNEGLYQIKSLEDIS